ncbi:IS4 family transposase, partial [Clostridium gasigenes]|nr:IS4 family transposase [Clostridium gasigenes]
LERFQCFLYGRLTALLLTSSIVFTNKKIIYEEHQKEISEMKSFAIVKEYFSEIREKIFKGELALMKFLNKLMESILKYGIKSRRKGRKLTFLILETVIIYERELVNMAV